MEIMEYAELFPGYFGEYIVGIYGMYTDGATNAGFNFSIPLPGKKRKRHALRVMLPEYFAFQYDMRSGNEYAHRSLGESYSVEPKSQRIHISGSRIIFDII